MAVNNYFELTLDTLAPTGSIKRSVDQQYLNSAASQNYQIAFGDASFMKVWTDTKAAGNKSDAEALEWVDAASSHAISFEAGENTYYGHLILVDSVGNESDVYNTEAMVYDPNAPVIVDVKIWDTNGLDDLKYDWTNDVENTISVTVENPGLANVVMLKLSGDVVEPAEIEVNLAGDELTYEGTVKLSEGDGAKAISVVAVDIAGNESVAKSCSIFLDQTEDEVTLVVNEISDNQWIQSRTVVATLAADPDVLENIQGYKIWENNTQSEPSSFKAWEAGNKEVSLELAEDGNYEIKAVIRDKAGSEFATKNTVKINVDNKAPIVTLAAKTAYSKFFSDVDGYNAIDVDYTVDSENKAPIVSYAITVDGNPVDGGRGVGASDVADGHLALTSSDIAGADGEYTITITATDAAGNVGTASDVVTRDVTSPYGEIEALSGWYTLDRVPVITVNGITDDTSGVAEMYAWFTTSNSDEVPEGAASITPSATKVLAMGDIYGTLVEGDNKVKIKLVDNVGNAIVLTDSNLKYDTVNPEVSIDLDSVVYNQESAVLTVAASDATSGVAYIVITGDVQDAPITSQWNNSASMDTTIKFTSKDGVKKVTVTAYDVAGNSTVSNTVSAELDTTAPSISANVYIKDTNAATVLPLITAVREFDLGVKAFDDAEATDNDAVTTTIKVWGDIVDHPGENSAYEVPFAISDGQSELMIISGLEYTEGDGEKKIYVKAIDNAGNATGTDAIVRTYDGTAPSISTLTHDHDRISVVHTLRHTAANEYCEHYADEVKVTFTPSEHIQKYTVSAHNTKTGERQILEGAEYNVEGLNSMASVTVTIKGEDYRKALGFDGTNDVDGLHAVVIEIWNLAGTKSEDIVVNI